MNILIIGLSKDRTGLLVKTKTMKNNFWHIHSNELTPYQKRIYKKLKAEAKK